MSKRSELWNLEELYSAYVSHYFDLVDNDFEIHFR